MNEKREERSGERVSIPAKAHGDGSGCDLGEAGDENEGRRNLGTGEPGGEGEWDGEAIGDAHDDIPHHIAGSEVLLLVTEQQPRRIRRH